MRKIAVILALGTMVMWCGSAWAQSEPACDAITIPGSCPSPPDETGNCGCDWFEDFESYSLGEIPQAPNNPAAAPGADPSNHWAGWNYNPGVLGEIDDAQDHTTGTGQSMRIDQGDDQVHWLLGRGIQSDGIGYDADVSTYWVHEGWIFVPTDHSADHFWIMNSHYVRFTNDPNSLLPTDWHAQFEFNSNQDKVWNSLFFADPPSGSPDLVKGEWSNIRVEMNFVDDLCLMFYDDNFVMGYQWAAAVGAGPDALFFGNLDLFSSNGSRAWYDDIAMSAAEVPPTNRPAFECILEEVTEPDRCATFMFRVHNENTEGSIAQFFIDVEAGEGGEKSACRGTANGISNVTPPPGWSVQNCTNWNSGHVLYSFTANTPGDEIAVGDTVTGFITLDVNKGREVESTTTGATIPPYTARMAAAQFAGNEAFAVCASGDYSFGPTLGGLQQWSGISACEAFLNVPATSTWAKVILLSLVLAGGTMLVLRSRRMATA